MKKIIVLIGIAGLIIGISGIASATNEGFETGDLTGWSFSGSAGVTISSGGYSPVEGSYFGYVGGTSSLTQSFNINSGQTISGSAGFKAEDYWPYNDTARVDILDSNNSVVNLWYRDVASVGNYGTSGWGTWNWTANTTGTYTLKLSVANVGDQSLPSYAYLDGISSGTNAVPEPMSLSLLGIGLLGAMGAGFRKKK